METRREQQRKRLLELVEGVGLSDACEVFDVDREAAERDLIDYLSTPDPGIEYLRDWVQAFRGNKFGPISAEVCNRVLDTMNEIWPTRTGQDPASTPADGSSPAAF